MNQIHATCVANDNTAILLHGPPGCGKSDLALRLIDDGAVLIADDRVDLSVREGRLIASAPQQIAGLLEVRGIGIVRLDYAREGIVELAFELVSPEKVDRLPSPATWEQLGVSIPLIKLDPFALSACAKVRLTVESLKRDIMVEPRA